ncbi:hypothetical protein [Pantoea piersonii]|jgi:hypothetical protein|uniref:hypothetical protein n=1 Tax=Pantoea piersonii TaxID=2364647 RepID=UPI000EA24CE4|nr:hypothetical protein [Pantoea piersonii]MBZ6385104.1 hypothetical protein [Pantoea piersonii]MBZ6385180.1 hypothetical protein [Pantoea piersonii]MBZ6398632.1 hypothetical protein [Pantoea piersonii]MBZ6398708.1 hypothetical protein [Pantoea piersonii]MBZ6406562.1 hypothetical protein [Pantoea piersonii]
MKTLNDWLNEGRKVESIHYAKMSRIKCADGYNVSIQASSGHYCTPRETMQDVQYYSSFELGYPSSADDAFLEYAENPDEPTDTVYGYVPREVIEEVIASHGGVVGYGK